MRKSYRKRKMQQSSQKCKNGRYTDMSERNTNTASHVYDTSYEQISESPNILCLFQEFWNVLFQTEFSASYHAAKDTYKGSFFMNADFAAAFAATSGFGLIVFESESSE